LFTTQALKRQIDQAAMTYQVLRPTCSAIYWQKTLVTCADSFCNPAPSTHALRALAHFAMRPNMQDGQDIQTRRFVLIEEENEELKCVTTLK
jgi:hypothetical protein